VMCRAGWLVRESYSSFSESCHLRF